MKKFLSLLLVMTLVLGLCVVTANATISNPLVTTDSIDGLTVSVDYNAERVYLQRNSSNDYTVMCDSTNGYYPFSLSVIMNDRTLVDGRPSVTAVSSTEDENLGFAWAYTDETGEEESATTNYGLATLPCDSASTIVITTTNNHTITLRCSTPCGGTTASGAEVYAYLPAPGQFTNEGVTTGGWGDIFDSNGDKKMNSATGVSTGFFGGYVVYKFDNPVANDPHNPYGADFIVYGNAFWENSEPGCIQVSTNGAVWYDIAGSKYYDSATIKNASITYTNPKPVDNTTCTTAGINLGTLSNVTYDGTKHGVILRNNFHNHSWFPLNCNYFTARYNETESLDKVEEFNFASVSGNTLTLSGVLLQGVSTKNTTGFAFGYCDVHPNNSLGGTIAYNPYQTFTSSSDYATKTSGTSGGDPIDISWAVDENGLPVKLDYINYVRIYTGTAQMNGAFGEISTEVCGIAACTGTNSSTVPTIKANIYLDNETSSIANQGYEVSGTQRCIVKNVSAGTHNITVSALSINTLYINGNKINGTANLSIDLVSGDSIEYQIITQTGNKQAYIEVLKLVCNE